MRRAVVYKLGGSLLALPGLRDMLRRILDQRPQSAALVVVGGGPSADIVRDWDRVHHLGDSASHWLALEAMQFNESLAHRLWPQLRVVRSPRQFDQAMADDQPALLCAACFVRWGTAHGHPLAESWDVTSDSIAAYAANVLEAEELVLLKSVPAPLGQTASDATRAGLVDAAFPSLTTAIPRISWVDARSTGCHIEPWLTARSD